MFSRPDMHAVAEEFHVLAGGDLWDRLADAVWQSVERQHEVRRQWQSEYRKNALRKAYLRAFARRNRARNKEIPHSARVCNECRKPFVRSLQQVRDGRRRRPHLKTIDGRFCSGSCLGKWLYRERPLSRPPQLIEFNGQAKTAAEWARLFGIGVKAVYERARRVRDKEQVVADHVCKECGRSYPLTAQQARDRKREDFCSLSCFGRWNYRQRPPPRPPQLVLIEGQEKSIAQWCEQLEIGPSGVYRRMRKGQSASEAILTIRAKR